MDTVFLNKIATREWVKERDRQRDQALNERLADMEARLEAALTGEPQRRGPGRPRKVAENGGV